ncbi:DUF3987 domain-containing protein [uncultured Halopseudomonas sp.]|uniref:DUF3987 domain-containing protein n=1 Tax=uncultured Halopseudomonas sp. TaxID=2901193 RepID=UPI0030ED298E|tara:strand:+ start:5869 stop:7542 length:1674 start_codon:yes stop_codon:yes gene_type:complete
MTLIPEPTYSKPMPLLPDTATPTPYPLEALPVLMREAVQAIAELEQVPFAIAGQCAIGAAAHLAQTRVNAWHPGGNPAGAPCALFMLTLFGSGEGKSSARRLAFKTIDEAEREARNLHRQKCEEISIQARQLKGKAREEFMEANPLPEDPRTQYSDATFEPLAGDFIRGKAAASWDTDEGGQMLGGSSLKADTVAATLGGLTKAFDAGHFERTRSRGNAEGSGVAYNRRLSIHLLAQPIAVAEALSNPLLTGQGFLARFLFAAPDSLAGTRFITVESLSRSAYCDARVQRYWARCKEIAASPEYIDPETNEVTPPLLDLDAAAIRRWTDLKNDIESELGPLGNYAGIKPFANRGAEQALRLAAVLGCFEGLEQINGDCLHRACLLVSYSLSEWLRYTEVGGASPLLKNAAYVMSWMLHPARVDNWQTFNKAKAGKSWPPAIRPAKKRDAVLTVLVEHKHILTTNGEQFRINPCAETAETAESQQRHALPVADELRIVAESRKPEHPAYPQSADFPQIPSDFPQPKTKQTRGLPQNPQLPQLPQLQLSADTQRYGGEL